MSMLTFSLIISSILLAIVLIASRSKASPGAVIVTGFMCVVLPLFLGIVLPAVLLHAVLLLLVACLCSTAGWRPRRFIGLACLASLTAYGFVGAFAYHDVARLLERFPYVSMEERLPSPKVQSAGPLAEPVALRLDSLEELIDQSSPEWPNRMRIRQLEQLHEHTVAVFARRPGFGMARMMPFSEGSLRRGLRTEEPIPQPGTRITFTWSTGDLEMPGKSDHSARNWEMHAASIADFVNVNGFGYVKDRQHVAGFQGHQFSQPLTADERWTLRSVDLVGLVLHDKPVVYVTANLPRMEELRDAATRPLDDFEAVGLVALRNGDDLFKRDSGAGRRLLGAIRSARQCVGCHGGERGDLLGAFSYTLTPEQ
jgi:hypothetical protein